VKKNCLSAFVGTNNSIIKKMHGEYKVKSFIRSFIYIFNYTVTDFSFTSSHFIPDVYFSLKYLSSMSCLALFSKTVAVYIFRFHGL
jgi:hypothetical protein